MAFAAGDLVEIPLRDLEYLGVVQNDVGHLRFRFNAPLGQTPRSRFSSIRTGQASVPQRSTSPAMKFFVARLGERRQAGSASSVRIDGVAFAAGDLVEIPLRDLEQFDVFQNEVGHLRSPV